MLENISSLKVQGGYFVNKTDDFPLFQNTINILYGRNGSGKTSISRAIREFSKNGDEDNEDRKYTVSFNADIDKSLIHVFNEDFIKEKVLVDSDGVGTIVMLGKQVEVDAAIAKLKISQSKLQGDYSKLLELREHLSNARNNASPLSCKKNLKIGLNGWASIDSHIKNTKTNSKISDDVLARLFGLEHTIAKGETLLKLQQKFKNDFELYQSTNNAVKLFWPKESFGLTMSLQEILNLLNIHIEKPTLTERDKIIISIAEGKYSKYINEVDTILADSELHVCPLCQRELTDSEKSDLQSRVRKFFNKSAEEYRERLYSIMNSINDVEPSLPSINNDTFVNQIGAIIETVQVLNRHLANIRTQIGVKIANIYADTRFDFDIAEFDKAISDYNKACDNLSKAIENYNNAIDEREALKDKLIEINNKIAFLTNKGLFEAYFKALAMQKDNESKIANVEKQIENYRSAILSLEQEKKQVKIALNFINQALHFIFYDKRRLVLVEGEGCYRLKSKGYEVKPKDVSLGERNIIGLCYFFASLFEGKNEDTKYTDEILAVIDDPISSFDFENRIGVISFLKWQFAKMHRGNSHSKALVLTHDIQVALDLLKTNEPIINIQQKLMCLSDHKLQFKNRKDISEYKQLLHDIYEFAKLDVVPDNSFTIGNKMRKVLEAYFSFNYANGYTNEGCLDIVLKDSDKKEYFKNTVLRLLLNGESHSEERVKAMNYNSEFVSETEKQRVAKDVLCLLYTIDSNHLKFVLKQQDVSRQIEKWLEEIEGI